MNRTRIPSPRSPRRTRRGAFTLVEMLLVITIIGILAALVVPKMMGRSEQAREAAARADLAAIKTALDTYEIDNGSYPKSLQDLIEAPRNARAWKGPYVDRLPQDPWGNPYVYSQPARRSKAGYDLSSVGPDGKEGSEDDFGNWTQN